MDMSDSGEMTTQEAFEREGWMPFLSRTAALRFPEVRTTLGSLRNATGTQMVIVGETTREECEAFYGRCGWYIRHAELDLATYFYKAIAE